MVDRFKAWYQRVLRGRFFVRLLFLYSVIIVATISLMAFFILRSVTGILTEQTIGYNMQVLQTLSNYFEAQNRGFKKLVNKIYSEPLGQDVRAVHLIETALGSGTGDDLPAYSSAYRALNNYLVDYGLASDNDMEHVLLVGADGGSFLNASRQSSTHTMDYLGGVAAAIPAGQGTNINADRLYYRPAAPVTAYEGGARSYVLYDYIREPSDPSAYMGYIAATYNPDSLRNAYSQFGRYLVGDVLVVEKGGGVIFDSSGEHYGTSFALLEDLPAGVGTFRQGGSIVNVVQSEEFGFFTIGIIPDGELQRSANVLSTTILALTVLCISLIILMSYVATKNVSGRIGNINTTLKRIREGNLSARADVTGPGDEITTIATNLNRMSETLGDTLSREYSAQLSRADAELKQKAAELYALQTQINPHFLYNTLEAIRMRALHAGDKETAGMVKLLAKLFRDTARGGLVVTLGDELAYCRTYLELVNQRYEGRLQVEFDLDDTALDCGMIKHVVQPLVENAVLHGIDLSRGGNRIRVKAGRHGGEVRVTVADNGHGMSGQEVRRLREGLLSPEEGGGSIGLGNVQARLRKLYGEQFGLEIESEEGLGTSVTLAIKALTREELAVYVQGDGGG